MLHLADDRVALTIDPDRGSRISELHDLRTRRQWLWSPVAPGEPEPLPIGACYDDEWLGGWDELFPNDAPVSFMGRDLPDHGELWSQPWQVVTATHERVSLRYTCRTVPADVEKTITLRDGTVDISYRVRNLDVKELLFLLKLHPAIAVRPGDQLLLPGGTVEPVDLQFSRILTSPGPFRWPTATDSEGRSVDLSRVPPGGTAQEFVYVRDLPDGWCGVRDGQTGRQLRIQFPLGVFPYCWLFMTYGGWRGHFVVVLEPCTNMPKDLMEAARLGTCARLELGGVLECTVKVSLQ